MSRVLLAVSLLLSFVTPAAAADRTALLLEELDRCDVATVASTGPRLDVLLALADGRSAREVADVLRGPRRCIGYVTTYGEGEDELVFVGGRASADATGALLWVDRGWWRIAPLPLGYSSGTNAVHRYGDARELFAGIGSTGSAGVVGVLGVRIAGPSAWVILHHVPGGEIRSVRRLDPDRLLIEGRVTTDRSLTWNSHPLWPYGAQWLFARRGDRLVEAAQRQSRDPYYLTTAFLAALRARDVETMRRFATNEAISDALTLPPMDRRITPLELRAPGDFLVREHMSWAALPTDVRTTAPSGTVWGTVANYDDRGRPLLEVVIRFDRDDAGWVIARVRGPFTSDPREALPTP